MDYLRSNILKNIVVITVLIFLLSFYSCSSDDSETLPPVLNTLLPISEIDLSSFLSEPSGIVFNPTSNSFFVVSDTISKIFEIDLNGNFIHSVTVDATDMEGITLSNSNDSIYIVEESNNKVTTFLLNGIKINSFTVDVSTNSVNGLEGITFDDKNSLFVVNEKLPRFLVELENNIQIRRIEITVVDDLSDVCYDSQLDCLWIISDESKKILKVSKTGSVISEWSIPFSKGEGITIVNNYLYVVRDSDSKMYVFNKPNN